MASAAAVEKGNLPVDPEASLLGAISISPPVADDSQYKDIGFGILFYANLVVIFSLACSAGYSALSQSGPSLTVFKDNAMYVVAAAKLADSRKLLGGMFFTLFLGSFGSVAWVYLLSRMAQDIINITFGFILVSTIVSAISLFFSGMFWGGAIVLAAALVSTGVFVYFRPRIAFASVNMKVACEAIKILPMTLAAAAVALSAQCIFGILWMMAAVGYATNEASTTISANGSSYNLNQCSTYQYTSAVPVNVGKVKLDCPGGQTCQACVCGDINIVSRSACFTPTINVGAYIGLLFSLIWASTTLANVVHCTTAGAVAAWWFAADDGLVEVELSSSVTHGHGHGHAPLPTSEHGLPGGETRLGYRGGLAVVRSSFKRAVTTSFGSICLGSLVVAVLRVLRGIVRYAAEKLRGRDQTTTLRALRLCLLSSLELLLRLLDRGVQYFNRYAFCYVAIYGLNFIDASTAVVKMFSDRGWTALVNDDIVDTVLTIGSWVGGLLVMLAAFGYASAVGLSAGNTSLVMAMGFFFGHLMFLITTGVVSSAVATVYVCFAERPEVFQSTHPLLYLELHGAWTVLYPNYRKMPPYDNDVVSVTSPSKGIPFSGAPGTGTGTGAGGAALQRVSAGGGWNTYRPPSEAEVLSRPDVNANFAEQDQVLAQSSLFAEPLAGSAYKPLFDIDAEAELGDRHLGNAFGYVNTPSPGTGTGPMTGMGRMSKIQTPSSAGRGSALHTRTTGAGAGTGNGMSVTEMASSAYSNLASIVLNSTAQAPVNVKTSTPLPAQPPVTAAPATDASTPQSTSITTASGNKPKTNAPLSAPVSAERPGHDDTVTF